MGEFHGDESEIEANYQEQLRAYEHEHADDWKYQEERINESSFRVT